MRKNLFSVDAYPWVVISMIALFVSGCKPEPKTLSLTDEPQSGIFYIKLAGPNDIIVDSSGVELRMPDGLKIVMDAGTFDKLIQPHLGLQDPDSPQKYVRVDASFRLEKEDVVTGIVQSEDGGGTERSRTYWVVKIVELRSADWYRTPD
jgi:hypothetical protein